MDEPAAGAKVSRGRRRGLAGAVTVLAVALALFHLYTGFFGALDAYMQRVLHLTGGLLLVIALHPLRPRGERGTFWGGAVDAALAAVAVLSCLYLLANYSWITAERFMLISPLRPEEKVLGVLLVITVLEACRRVVGTPLLLVVLAFAVYPLVGSRLPGLLRTSTISWTEWVDFLFLTPNGIFGIPLGVSATQIAVFMLFAALLTQTGAGQLLFDLAMGLAGRSRGGPAKVAVVASAFMGTISGSGTANVVTTGAFTIPMMVRLGYRREFAAAVEAVASTGGQIMPPVMGATAFVMAAFTGIPYVQIVKYALIPAILYFSSVFFMTHLEAGRLHLSAARAEVDLRASLLRHAPMLIPLGVLMALLAQGYSPMLAGSWGCAAVIVLSILHPRSRPTVAELAAGLEAGAKTMLVVIVATAAAGIIVGALDMTGLGQRLGSAVVQLGGDHLFLTLLFTMFLALILGMGMPTTPAYIIQAAFVIPALITLGLPMPTAHMFAFYFACLSLITPPVAISAYAAAGIANADVMRTGWTAFRLGIAAYIVPFMFVLSPSLLGIGDPWQVALALGTALLGVYSLAVAAIGYFLRPAGPWERLVALAASLLLMAPVPSTALPGLFLLGLLWLYQRCVPAPKEAARTARTDPSL